MKLFLLKTLLQPRDRDDGYVLPMVIAVGLVMMLLGAVNLTSAKEESFSAITQNSRSDALAIAEIGVAQYRELLDRNRILTIYNHGEWTSNNVNGVDVAGQTCDVITNVGNGWASSEPAGTAFNAANWRAVTLDEATVNRDLNNDGDAVDNNVNIGWYKIVDYEYDIDGNIDDIDLTTPGIQRDPDDSGVFNVVSDANTDDDPVAPGTPPPPAPVGSITDENDVDDDGQSDARGILTVKGRTPDGSEAQIEVEIPIRINDLNNFAPVLWIGDGAITTPSNLSVPNPDDNIVLANSANCDATGAMAGNTNVIRDPRGIPPIINDPEDATIGLPATRRNDAGTINTSGGRQILPSPRTIVTPAAPGVPAVYTAPDNKTSNDSDGRFLYVTNSLTVANNDLITDGVSKVTLYVKNNINITGSAANTPTNPLTIGNSDSTNLANFNNGTTNVSSHNLEIYGTAGTTQINIDPNGGNINIEAFIHAPNAVLNITSNGQININGALWIRNITNTGGANLIIRGDRTDTTTADEPSYKFYTTSASRTPRPLTGSPINWKTEEVN